MKQKICILQDVLPFKNWHCKTSKQNKKLILLFCVFIFAKQIGYSQGDDDYSSTDLYSPTQVLNPSIKNPDAAAFEKVNFIPVSNYTGRANISIPIYAIVAGKMSVPITLSYNSSGVKVSDIPSSVGSNWALNAGGVLSRSIKGLDDFSRGRTFNYNYKKYKRDRGWLSLLDKKPLTGAKNKYRLGDMDDFHPDLFTASAPGLSVRYYHTKTSRSLDNEHIFGGEPILFGDSKGVIIKETFGLSTATPWYNYTTSTLEPTTPTDILGITKATITNISGIRYTFDAPSFSFNSNLRTGRVNFESLQLTSMYDPSTNQSIQFHYQEYGIRQFDIHPSGLVYYREGANIPARDVRVSQHLSRRRLEKISWNGGSVKFEYNHQRTDVGGNDFALSSIIIYDSKNKIVKKVNLEYSNFQSSIQSDKSQSRRLRLDKVYEVDPQGRALPGHQFFYDTNREMPPRNSYAHDYLGYNNGSYDQAITKPDPKLYFVKPYTPSPPLHDSDIITSVRQQPVIPFYDAGSVSLGGNYSLEANLEYAKTYSLNKIIYPTGGIAEYEYELNEFFYRGKKRKGGGLRVKSQKLIDEYGKEQILDYTYFGGSINNFPSFGKISMFSDCSTPLGPYCANITYENGVVKGIGITKYRIPNSQVELTQGAFVGYHSATVRNRIDNGYTFYSYHTSNDYKNIPSTKKEFKGNGILSYTLGAGELSADQDIYRGKLISEAVYDKDDRLITQKKYEYESKKFDYVTLNYFNQANPRCLGLDKSCDGFKEELKIPIERNLLSKVISNDYSSFYTNTDPRDNPILEKTEVFKTQTSYQYHEKYPLVVSQSQSRFGQCNENIESCISQKRIQYPFSSSLPLSTDLIKQNRLSESMSILIEENGKRKVKEEIYFKKYGKLINLEKVNYFGNNIKSSFSDIITKRTITGKIQEYQHKNGSFTTYLYGYDGSYVVAEISNAKLEEVETILADNSFSLNELYLAYGSLKIEKITNLLRKELPEAHVVSYIHKPLVGITSVTDSRGRKQTFHYDSFNRLQMAKDHEGNIISENQYHYKNQ